MNENTNPTPEPSVFKMPEIPAMNGKTAILNSVSPVPVVEGNTYTGEPNPVSALLEKMKGNKGKKSRKTTGAFGNGRKHNGVTGWKRSKKINGK